MPIMSLSFELYIYIYGLIQATIYICSSFLSRLGSMFDPCFDFYIQVHMIWIQLVAPLLLTKQVFVDRNSMDEFHHKLSSTRIYTKNADISSNLVIGVARHIQMGIRF